MNRRRSAVGFSLIEMMVVVGIIAILMGILLPVLSRARRNAQSIVCEAHLHEIGVALALYGNDNRGNPIPYLYPAGPRWPQMLFQEPFPLVVLCPASESSAHPIRLSYQINCYLRGMGWQWIGQRHIPTAAVVLAGESKPGYEEPFSESFDETGIVSWALAHHGPGLLSNYLYLDFHVSNDIPISPVGSSDPWKPY